MFLELIISLFVATELELFLSELGVPFVKCSIFSLDDGLRVLVMPEDSGIGICPRKGGLNRSEAEFSMQADDGC